MRLLIVSNMAHYLDEEGKVWGWGPTVEEINHLAKIFRTIRHVACLYPSPPPPCVLPYLFENIQLIPVPPSGGPKLRDKISILFQSQAYLQAISQESGQADVVHIRCPANISLMAIVLLAFVRQPRFRWVKYAGNWVQEHPPFSYRFQRWWLTRGFHGGPVTINGKWPGQPAHLFSFYNPCLTLAEIQKAYAIAKTKFLQEPIRLLFVGRVEAAKGIGRVLEIVAGLRLAGLRCRLDIIGDGPQREIFEKETRRLKIDDVTHFLGWMPKDGLFDFYAKAHFIILPTTASEGFPKVLSEAMAYGVVPVAGAVSSIPQILGEKGTGMALCSEDTDAFIMAIQSYVQEPQRWRNAVEAGLEAAACFTYERYLLDLDQMFRKVWGNSPMKLTTKAPYPMTIRTHVKSNEDYVHE